MNERNMPFRVGVMLLATFLIALILLLSKGPSFLLPGKNTIYIKFDKAPGVMRNTPVHKAGILIGRVQDVRFADHDTKVIVTADIDNDRHVYSDEQCRVTNSFPMGDAALEIVPIPNFQGEPTELKSGSFMPTAPSAPDMTGSIAGLEGQARLTMSALNTTAATIDRLARRVDDLVNLNAERITETIANVRQFSNSLNDPNVSLGTLLHDKELAKNIDELTANVRQFSQRLNDPNNSLGALLHDNKELYQHVNGVAANLDELTGKLSDPNNSLGALLHDNKELYRHVNGMAANLDELTGKLSDPNNSLGALLHDNKELYQRVNHIVKNADELSRDLKPILNDVRVFSDKIARHPESLGVRGAIKKDVGLKDTPASDGSETNVPESGRWPLGGSGRWSIGR